MERVELERVEPADPERDWRLLERAADGDEEAFARLVEAHQGRLVRLCERLLHDREEACDAAQEVFIKAFRKARSLEPRGQLYTWLYRVATNNCLNRLRRRRIVRFLPLVADEGGRGARRDPADPAPDADRRLEARRRWSETRRAISRLPPSQRTVLVLARFEGRSYREIAELLGISVGAVEGRLFRALRKLTQGTAGTDVPRREKGS